MSSAYSPWIYRKLLYHIPGLFVKCPEGNYHPIWSRRVCFCVDDCDLLDMKTGEKYVLLKSYERILSELWDDGPVQKAYLKKLHSRGQPKTRPTPKGAPQQSVEADAKIRMGCAILEEVCIDCEEDCPAAKSV